MKVLRNFAYTSGYQIFSIIVPIITTPYISRQLGPSGMGINAFSLSLVQVFVLFAYLGTQKYGNNMISKSRDDDAELISNFKSIYVNQLLTTTVTLLLYVVYVLLFINKYQELYFIQGLYLLSVYFDVSWFFQGKEDFKTTVIRGMGSKLLGVALIFILIKGPQGTVLYGFILAVSSLMANIAMWVYLWYEINWRQFLKVRLRLKPFINQLRHIFTYFIPVAFLQITTQMYQLILGWHASATEVAYYANASKIIIIPLYIITSFITVMFPRISYELASEGKERVADLLKSSVEITMLLSIPLTFGMIAISSNFVDWFFGPGFVEVSSVMIILSLRIIPATLNEAFGYLYLMADGKATLYSLALSIGGAVSLILNFVVTLAGGADATAWVSVISEVLIMLAILFFSRSKAKVLLDGLILRSFLYSILMFIPIYFVGLNHNGSIFITVVQIILAILIYGGLILIFERSKIHKILRSFTN